MDCVAVVVVIVVAMGEVGGGEPHIYPESRATPQPINLGSGAPLRSGYLATVFMYLTLNRIALINASRIMLDPLPAALYLHE